MLYHFEIVRPPRPPTPLGASSEFPLEDLDRLQLVGVLVDVLMILVTSSWCASLPTRPFLMYLRNAFEVHLLTLCITSSDTYICPSSVTVANLKQWLVILPAASV